MVCLPTFSPSCLRTYHITNPPAPQGNFPIPFPSHSRTSKNRNASTQTQLHKTTEYEGEAKDTITKSDKPKRRKVAGQFQAGRESEKKNTDGGRGSFPFYSLTSTSLSPRTLSQREESRSSVPGMTRNSLPYVYSYLRQLQLTHALSSTLNLNADTPYSAFQPGLTKTVSVKIIDL